MYNMRMSFFKTKITLFLVIAAQGLNITKGTIYMYHCLFFGCALSVCICTIIMVDILGGKLQDNKTNLI